MPTVLLVDANLLQVHDVVRVSREHGDLAVLGVKHAQLRVVLRADCEEVLLNAEDARHLRFDLVLLRRLEVEPRRAGSDTYRCCGSQARAAGCSRRFRPN